MFVYLWEYHVAPDHVAAFERRYGPEGDWVALFRRARGYLDTTLLVDHARAGRYVTIDRWESETAHTDFLRQHGEAFSALDAESEELTQNERLIGHFSDRP